MTTQEEPRVTLLPCPNPWCEGEDGDGDFAPVPYRRHFGNWAVGCTRCSMDGPIALTKAEAIAAWNTRPAEAASKAQVEALMQALVNHNDVLRSAYQIAARKGAQTEWEGFTLRAGSVLHFHHEEVEAARVALERRTDGGVA